MRTQKAAATFAALTIALAPLALAGCSSDTKPTEKPYEITVTCKDGSGSVPEIEKFDIVCVPALHAAETEALAQQGPVSIDVTYMGRYTSDKAPISGMLDRAALRIKSHNDFIAQYVRKWQDAAVTVSPNDSLYDWYVERSEEKRAMIIGWAEKSRADTIKALGEIKPPEPANPHARSSSPSDDAASSEGGIPMWAKVVGGIVLAISAFFVFASWEEKHLARREEERQSRLRQGLDSDDDDFDLDGESGDIDDLDEILDYPDDLPAQPPVLTPETTAAQPAPRRGGFLSDLGS